MKRLLIYCLIIVYFNDSFCQSLKTLESGLRELNIEYQNVPVYALIRSKVNEDQVKKPIILYIQGSQGRPLIINYPESNNFKYSIAFPFNCEQLLNDFHLIVIAKPFIPVVANIEHLNNYTFIDSTTQKSPIGFLKNDNLTFYTQRNIFLLKKILKLDFVNSEKVIILGHSEGSRIAVAMASKFKKITHLGYLSGNPYGRFINLIARSRKNETENDNDLVADFNYWKEVVDNKDVNNYLDGGDTFKSTFEYAQTYVDEMVGLKIPVFVGYGTGDEAAIFNDLFRVQALSKKKSNFTFKSFYGLEHSFYPITKSGEVNYESGNFDAVILDFLHWLQQN
ncbi:hypothetical protein [Flavobacterium aurantiibacter]|uniref:Dienelactone hydrolase domain-containing protein n=1 Tax=Flavobacterium aurantiibacter TaxID=2023067 RepID=A0A256A9W4_9FLAO|nr:hypothetical protein [Flavobacterium aurantiibacter]OYQ50506.1 hypothetical protein CHX27_00865 [Flavobacterium aurantiibacter]